MNSNINTAPGEPQLEESPKEASGKSIGFDNDVLAALPILTEVLVDEDPTPVLQAGPEKNLPEDLPPLENQPEQKSELALRLIEVQERSKVQVQRAVELLELYGSDVETAEGPVESNYREIYNTLKDIESAEDITPIELISRSKKVLSDKEQLDEQGMRPEWKKIQVQREQLRENDKTIDRRIEDLKKEKGIKGILATREINRLEERRKGTGRYLSTLNDLYQKNVNPAEKSWANDLEYNMREKSKKVVYDETIKSIQAISSEYEQLYNDILEDGSVAADIRETYIQETIAPAVDAFVEKSGTMTSDQREAFYRDLHIYIDHRQDPQDKRGIYREQLIEHLKGGSKFLDNDGSAIMKLIDPLLNGYDTTVIKNLVRTIGAKDFDLITEVYPKSLPSDFDSKKIYTFIGGSYRSNEDDLSVWRATAASKVSNEVFGDIIQQQDTKYYTSILKGSLHDLQGNTINKLYYYPTPDGIRNLVIIAAADPKGFRATHANGTLYKLSKRPDWPKLLDQAEIMHPSLRDIRTVLEPWEFRGDGDQLPEMQEAVSKFSRSLLESDGIDPQLTELTTEALPNRSILDILSEKGRVQKHEVEILQKAEIFLTELSRETIRRRQQNDSSVPSIFYSSLRNEIRTNVFELLQADTDKPIEQSMENIRRLSVLSKRILENQQDYTALSYLSNESVIKKLQDQSLGSDQIEIFLEAYKTVPELASNHVLVNEFCKQFEDNQTLEFFNNANTAYAGLENQLVRIVSLVGNSRLSRERALELPGKANDILSGELSQISIDYPEAYLATDQACEFFRSVSTAYQQNEVHIRQISKSLSDGDISEELALAFPKQATALMDDKMRETRLFVFTEAKTLLKDASDISFINTLVGEFGMKSDPLIRDYQQCLAEGVITLSAEDKKLVLEFVRQIRVASPTLLQEYKQAKEAGNENAYIAQLRSLADRMAGSGVITEEERKTKRYKDILKHVYSNNSGQWASFESNESCSDRTSDLDGFKIRPRYEIDLLSQSEIRVKKGETFDTVVNESAQRPILEVAQRMDALGHDKEKINVDLHERVDKAFQEITDMGGLKDINLDSITTLNEKLFLILADSMYGDGVIDRDVIKDLIITYEFATFEDITDYIAGTRDRVGRSNNQDYALMCEVDSFYSNSIKEINRIIVQEAWNNPTIASIMPRYFEKLAQDTATANRNEMINRMQVGKLGTSETFINQAIRVLEKRNGKQYTPDQVREIVRRYEDITGGLTDSASTSSKPGTRAFYGQLRTQRKKTFEALESLTGEKIDPTQVHLGEINLQQVLDAEESVRNGEYNQEQFAAYTAQRFIDIFGDERGKIEGELAKFESISGMTRELLYGYVTKSKESAHARMVGGVCVAGDNPNVNGQNNMWDMPNYFQMVLQEPDTLQCQGLVLIHSFTENGKRILTVSLNPSSTYLYSVDEQALFNSMVGSLEQFALDNQFDLITTSRNVAIRTNRTGGIFEKTMDERIAQVGKSIKLDTPKPFSVKPKYEIQEVDVIWERQVQSTSESGSQQSTAAGI